MSRIGRAPITVPAGVEFRDDRGVVTVKGPKGELTQRMPREMIITLADGTITVARPTDSATHRSLHGLTRTLIANMVQGVLVGFSHPAVVAPPEGIEFQTPQPQVVLVRGIDKQAVGEVAAQIRALRPPEPYKGKGIRYAGEYVARKVGKRA